MGNAALRQLAALESVAFDDISGSVIAVDAHNWLYRYLTTTVKFTSDAAYTTESGVEVANLIGVVQGLPKFFEHDLTPVFVFDGGVTELKDEEVQERRVAREEAVELQAAAEERGDELAASRLEARTQRLTETIHETTRGLLNRLDVPIIEAPAEGEAQAAEMAIRGDVDYVGSEDYDTLLFGAPYTVRQLTSKGDPELMDLQTTLKNQNLTREQLVDVAILCGTDFNDGISGIGPATAISAINDHGDLWSVLDARDEFIQHADRVRSLFLDPPVTNEYTLHTTINPDMDAARSYVVDDWEVPADEVERGFERIETSVVQTGLDEWI
ncbi:flap endonuclease-1 [Haloquadratum walsbyi]|uniref:Flap endonuclease 1 n=1 Tax=Haloquadratum walsbyi (strain DSM 16790 / HBSQ001) TaxID=362976 RepID=FEN_HALWD|nr:flap endonuclease-1 [Haloquadratum walsbyi]Q18HK0.1 RecName: Full=Flap endonuclease 1; Short=FEN-1; AltName: Full=Flap structure-specific endonuclease 1 [Haloquadratum walsbyi DSM 16790]CAJ52538.1 flap endonuclease Fen1 [Haloquadratum walsbyi DSM 16790]